MEIIFGVLEQQICWLRYKILLVLVIIRCRLWDIISIVQFSLWCSWLIRLQSVIWLLMLIFWVGLFSISSCGWLSRVWVSSMCCVLLLESFCIGVLIRCFVCMCFSVGRMLFLWVFGCKCRKWLMVSGSVVFRCSFCGIQLMCRCVLCLIIFFVGVISLRIICIRVDLLVLLGFSRVKILSGVRVSEMLDNMWCWLKVIEIFFSVIRFVIVIQGLYKLVNVIILYYIYLF